MICPSCSSAMFERQLSGVQLDACSECNMLFFDQGELQRAVEGPDSLEKTLRARAGDGVRLELACPRCSSTLARVATKQAELDVCLDCRGILMRRSHLDHANTVGADAVLRAETTAKPSNSPLEVDGSDLAEGALEVAADSFWVVDGDFTVGALELLGDAAGSAADLTGGLLDLLGDVLGDLS